MSESTGKKPYDLDSYLQACDDDRELMVDLLKLFIATVPESIRRFREYHARQQWADLRMEAHKLWPNLAGLGIKEWSAEVGEIEQITSKRTGLERLPALIERSEA